MFAGLESVELPKFGEYECEEFRTFFSLRCGASPVGRLSNTWNANGGRDHWLVDRDGRYRLSDRKGNKVRDWS